MLTNDEIETALRAVGEMRGEILRLKAEKDELRLRLDALESRARPKPLPITARGGLPNGVTPKDVRTIRIIQEFWSEERRGPSLTELADRFGVCNQTMSARIEKLRRRGVIAKNPMGRQFAIRVLWDPDAPTETDQSRNLAGPAA